MNSEEIKEIGQMFLNISNQNHNMNLGLTDEDIIKGVTNQMEEKLQEFKKDFTLEIQEAYAANVTPRIKKIEDYFVKVESELKDLRNNTRIKQEAFDSFRYKVRNDLQVIESNQRERDKTNTVPEDSLYSQPLKDRVKELGAKVGKFGNQVGGYGGLISTLQKNYGERTAELKKIRKDYRELQDEMWERFKLVEAWVETKDSADKERIRLEILENGHTDKSEQAKQKLSSSLDTVENTPDATCVEPKKNTDSEIRKLAHKVLHRKAEETKGELTKKDWLNWETSTSFAWSKIPISKLNNVSVRAHNALIVGGYQYIGSLLTQSPYDLIQVPNFGRKCLREVMTALEEKNLTLNMQKFNEQKEERNSKNNTQRGNLYGFKS